MSLNRYSRRDFLIAGLRPLSLLLAASQCDAADADLIKDLLREAEVVEGMRRAREEDIKAVEALYSTKLHRVLLGDLEYQFPINYITPRGRDEPNTFVATNYGFGFYLFLPDFGGYTKQNWRDQFDLQLITVSRVRRFNPGKTKNDAIERSSRHGDPWESYQVLKQFYRDTPSFKSYGLEGYKSRGQNSRVLWTGQRSDGDFVFLLTSLAPGVAPKPGITNPQCVVRYLNRKDGLYIDYRYSQDHLEKWRDVDDGIWAKLNSWRVR